MREVRHPDVLIGGDLRGSIGGSEPDQGGTLDRQRCHPRVCGSDHPICRQQRQGTTSTAPAEEYGQSRDPQFRQIRQAAGNLSAQGPELCSCAQLGALRVHHCDQGQPPALGKPHAPAGHPQIGGPYAGRGIPGGELSLGGAVLVLAADIAVRLVPGANEVKLGVAMAALGGPFFFALLMQMRRRIAG